MYHEMLSLGHDVSVAMVTYIGPAQDQLKSQDGVGRGPPSLISSRGVIGGWWLLGEEESLFFRSVAIGRLPVPQG